MKNDTENHEVIQLRQEVHDLEQFVDRLTKRGIRDSIIGSVFIVICIFWITTQGADIEFIAIMIGAVFWLGRAIYMLDKAKKTKDIITEANTKIRRLEANV